MWQTYDSLVTYFLSNKTLSSEILLAAFDLDSTLIFSDSGEKYATLKGFVYAYSNIPETLKKLHNDGYIIAIFSNRSNATYGMVNCKNRIEKIIRDSQVPIDVFLSTSRKQNNPYRKPGIGMLQLYSQLYGFNNLKKGSFFCGDAAGEESVYIGHRWSNTDKLFAQNAKLIYYEPPQIFELFKPGKLNNNIKLTITVGPTGWEKYPIGEKRPTEDGRYYIFVENPHRYIPGEIQVVIGKHPTKNERNQIIQMVGVTLQDTNFLYYCNLHGAKVDDNYVKSFDKFTNENVIRMN